MDIFDDIKFFQQNEANNFFLNTYDKKLHEKVKELDFQLIIPSIFRSYQGYVGHTFLNIPYNMSTSVPYDGEKYRYRLNKLVKAHALRERAMAKEDPNQKQKMNREEGQAIVNLYVRLFSDKMSGDYILSIRNSTNVKMAIASIAELSAQKREELEKEGVPDSEIPQKVAQFLTTVLFKVQMGMDSPAWKVIFSPVRVGGKLMTKEPVVDAKPCNLDALYYSKANPFADMYQGHRRDEALLAHIDNELADLEEEFKEYL
jgi:hypothetical protein